VADDFEIELAGERMCLLPERAMHWSARQTLLITDTHWGKAASLRANAVPVPGGTTNSDLARLSLVLERTRATRLVILGDVIHARDGRSPSTFAAVRAWRAQYPLLEILLVRGNHDKAAGDPPPEFGIQCEDAPFRDGPFLYRHFPHASDDGYSLAGHLHPAVKLHGLGGQRVTLPCFHFQPRVGILPAFGALTGMARVNSRLGDRVFAIAEEEIIEFVGESVDEKPRRPFQDRKFRFARKS
jgi:DNA ligase-associated metallophosphoesterase